jgi:hypothetical protein
MTVLASSICPLLALALASSVLACSEAGSALGTKDAGTRAQDGAADVAKPPKEAAASEAGTPGLEAGAPYLKTLEIASSGTADGSASIELVPAFSPTVFDYYVLCAAGPNAVSVSMSASPGASSALSQPDKSPASPQQTLSVSVAENQAIVATATAGKMTTEYWVRCLPQGFPPLQLDAHPEAGTPPPGYYIVGNSGSPPGYPMVLDGNGVPVWYTASAMSGVDDVDNVVSGAISFFKTWTSDPVSVLSLDPLATAQAAPSDMELDTHELRVLSNGDYLVFSYPLLTGLNLTGIPNIDVADAGVEGTQIFDCVVVEFSPKTGNVVWTWVASDHFDPVQDSVSAGMANQLGVIAVDAFHCNSIDVDPNNGNLLVSTRNMSSVFYIDRSTGAVVWKMGGSSYSKDGAIYVPVSDPFIQQHDARLQGWSETSGKGQISVFDDQSSGTEPARALLLDVTTGVGGTTPGATVAWQYKAQGNSSDRGSFRISPDGSRVIGWGHNVAAGLVFTEVDDQGHDLMDFYFPNYGISYRAIKVPLSTFDLEVLRNTAGLP